MEIDKIKKEQKKQIAIKWLKLIHFVCSIVLFFVFWIQFRYHGFHVIDKYGFRYNYYIMIGYGILLLFFYRTYNSYLLGYSRVRSLVFGQFLAQLFSVSIIYFVVSIGWAAFHNPLPFFLLLGLQLFLDMLWSPFASYYFYKKNTVKKTLLIYRNSLDRKRLGTITGKPSERLYQIVEELHYDGNSFKEIQHRLEGYDAIFVAGVNSRCRNGILKYCKEKGIPGFFLPHVGDVIMQEAIHIQSFDSPVLFVNRKYIEPEYGLIKRLFDIMASATGLILLSPIMFITAMAIKLYDGGSPIYKQTRLTKDGQRFCIYKFRSMREDAEKDGIARLSSGDKDDRITPIGRIVRKCRLDELPQLLNILKGDMSIVGPRPERPEIAEQYYKQMPEFKLRLQVKAGLTGYAQVYGKYNTDPYEKLEFDLLYINNMSVLTDLKIMFATFSILFSPESTEGVAAGQTTAIGSETSVANTETKAETE